MNLKDEISNRINGVKLADAFSRSSKEERVGSIAFVYCDAMRDVALLEDAESEQLYRFNGKSYEPISRKEVELAVRESMVDKGVSPGTIVRYFRSMMASIWMTVSLKHILLTKRKICFDNCVFDVDTRRTLAFSPALHVVSRIGYAYDPKARCPRWRQFLEEVLPDEECRTALQEFFSLVFLDRSTNKLERMMVLMGSGANGKSVVFDVIQHVVGACNISKFELKTLIGESATCQYNLASIDGKLLNYCTELDKKVIDSTKVKTLISGEPIPARHPYGRPFDVYNLPIMVANANDYPKTNDHSAGFFRRFLIIPFEVTIPEARRNQTLSYELREEASGIFNWLIEGLDRAAAKEYRIATPEKSVLALDRYKTNSNSVLTFLKEERLSAKPLWMEQGPSFYSAREFYTRYATFCAEAHFAAYAITEFGKLMGDNGFQKVRRGSGLFYVAYALPLPSDFAKLRSRGLINCTQSEFYRKCGYFDMLTAHRPARMGSGPPPEPELEPELEEPELDDPSLPF